MMDKKQVLKQMDSAIDSGDMNAVEEGLSHLAEGGFAEIMAEDPLLFSARIQKTNKEKSSMKPSRKIWKTALIAAVIAALGITVYATGALRWFSFQSGDKYVTMYTTESMSDNEARAFVDADHSESVPDDAVMREPDVETMSFDALPEAENALGIPLALPGSLPEMNLDGIEGEIVKYGDGLESRMCWVNWSDENGRLFGLTVGREIVPAGLPVTSYTLSDMDDGSLGSYTSKSGVKYTTLTESDDAGERTAHIATTVIGQYEYSLVFFGFDEEERQQIIDSADLSAYQ